MIALKTKRIRFEELVNPKLIITLLSYFISLDSSIFAFVEDHVNNGRRKHIH